MDANSRTAAATIVGALIGATATVVAAYMNLIKPTEKQVVGSDVFQHLAAANTGLQTDVREARRQVDSLEAENRGLRDSVSQLKTTRPSSLSSEEAVKKQEQLVAELRQTMQQLETENESLRRQLRTSPLASAAGTPNTTHQVLRSPPRPKRQELTLVPSQAMRVNDELTVTAEPFNPGFGLTVFVNGKKKTYLRAGEQVPVSKTPSEDCFLEVMSLPTIKQTSAPSDIRVDYVCRASR